MSISTSAGRPDVSDNPTDVRLSNHRASGQQGHRPLRSVDRGSDRLPIARRGGRLMDARADLQGHLMEVDGCLVRWKLSTNAVRPGLSHVRTYGRDRRSHGRPPRGCLPGRQPSHLPSARRTARWLAVHRLLRSVDREAHRPSTARKSNHPADAEAVLQGRQIKANCCPISHRLFAITVCQKLSAITVRQKLSTKIHPSRAVHLCRRLSTTLISFFKTMCCFFNCCELIGLSGVLNWELKRKY